MHNGKLRKSQQLHYVPKAKEREGGVSFANTSSRYYNITAKFYFAGKSVVFYSSLFFFVESFFCIAETRMPYISADGTVQEERSMWRLSIISDIFWSTVNEIGLFFQTLINPTAPIPQNRISSTGNISRGSSGGGGGAKPDNKTSIDRPRGSNIHTLPKQCTTNR